ncbi:MAG: cob(I)yrinic acid a,c-diamide adenosyltransferase [Bacillota bacterium]
MDRQGLVMIFTGDGKGKTTAAVGLGVRAAGHDRRVLMIQFLKGSGRDYGEARALQSLPSFRVARYGQGFVLGDPDEAHIRRAREGLARAREAMAARECDLLILDEINVAIACRLVRLEEVLDLLAGRPQDMDVVLTGRGAPRALMDQAHMVSDVQEVKHHYRTGVQAQAGVEF